MDEEPVVFLVAGDAKIRRALALRLGALGLQGRAFHSTEDFLEAHATDCTGCVLLNLAGSPVDVDLLPALGRREDHLPVIGLVAAGDVSTAVLAMKLGAMDCLDLSCPDALLAEAITEALRWEAVNRRRISQVEHVRRRLARLDPKHRSVLDMLVMGKSNREIATELELSVRAIEVRRAKIMQTMRAKSLADLVRLTILVEGCGKLARAERREPGEDGAMPGARFIQ